MWINFKAVKAKYERKSGNVLCDIEEKMYVDQATTCSKCWWICKPKREWHIPCCRARGSGNAWIASSCESPDCLTEFAQLHPISWCNFVRNVSEIVEERGPWCQPYIVRKRERDDKIRAVFKEFQREVISEHVIVDFITDGDGYESWINFSAVMQRKCLV